MYAAEHNQIKTAYCLLENNAQPNLATPSGDSALSLTTCPTLVKYLIGFKADPYAQTGEGESPIARMRRSNSTDLLDAVKSQEKKQAAILFKDAQYIDPSSGTSDASNDDDYCIVSSGDSEDYENLPKVP